MERMEDTYSSSAQALRGSESSFQIIARASLFNASGGARNKSLVGAKALEVDQLATTEVSAGGAREGAGCIDALEI